MRDVVAFSPDAALRFREALAAEGVLQSAVLSTCNRCEVFYWVPSSIWAEETPS